MNIPFSIIVAVDSNLGIGKGGNLPWHLSADLKHVKKITTQTSAQNKRNVLIMGRKTWESIPEKYRPLEDRINVVLSRNKDLSLPDGVLKADSLENALIALEDNYKETFGNVFIFGGEKLFRETIVLPDCQKIYLTQIQHEFDCDTFFPGDLSSFEKISESPTQNENGIAFSFIEYSRCN